MSKLRVTLKQHTPLIHFQWDQYGATIRATEFKPKLDKFLIEHAFNNKFEEYKQYLVGYKDGKTEKDYKDKKAFDYKVRFCNIKGQKIPCEINSMGKKKFPLYFANMGKGPKNKFILFDTIDVEFFSLKQTLLEKINEELPLFFMKHNFGQRQSKGFGSLYINEYNEYYINGIKKIYVKQHISDSKKLKYKFEVKIKNNNSIVEKGFMYKQYLSLFSEIESFYNSLRTGNKRTDSYIKNYAFKKNMTWDKDIIKNKYDNANLKNKYKGYLIKDLLGLSVEERWFKQRFKITKLDKEKEIQRFQSPIFFKPIRLSKNEFNVYFEANEIPKEFLDKTFLIQKDGKGNLELKTPKKFDMNDFIEYVKREDSILDK